jgi:hypothetical protein
VDGSGLPLRFPCRITGLVALERCGARARFGERPSDEAGVEGGVGRKSSSRGVADLIVLARGGFWNFWSDLFRKYLIALCPQ